MSDGRVETAANVLLDNGDGTCTDVQTGRVWQMARQGRFSLLQSAEEYAENLVLAGHNDWRLPTREEMLRLHRIYFWRRSGNCKMDMQGDYWTISADGRSSSGHWETYYLCGPEFEYKESRKPGGYVHAVRP